MEIFVGCEFANSKERKRTKELLESFEKVSLNEELALLATKIGREQKLGFLGTVDLVVAATALKLNAEVATHNLKHFRQIKGLKIFNLTSKKRAVLK